MLGGGQPVGDGGAVRPSVSPLDGVAQRHLGGRVDRRGGLVQDQAARVGQVAAGQGDQLALAHRQVVAALADPGVHALRQPVDPAAQPQGLEAARLAVAGVGAAHADVLGHAGVEQEAVLGDHDQRRAQRGQADLAQVDAGDPDRPGGRVGQPMSSLARVVLPDRWCRPGPPGCRRGCAPGRRRGPAARRGRRTTPGPARCRGLGGQGQPGARVLDLDRGVEHVQDLLPAGHRLLGHVQDLGELRPPAPGRW